MRSAWIFLSVISISLMVGRSSLSAENPVQVMTDLLFNKPKTHVGQVLQKNSWAAINHVTNFIGWTKAHEKWSGDEYFASVYPVIDTTARYDYPAKTKLYINFQKMAQCLLLAERKSKIPASYNSRGEKCVREFRPVSGVQRPTLLEYLGAQRRECDLASGKESSLLAWLQKQPNNSVDPVSIFAKSYELNGGNIYQAILTIHQVLRPLARFYDPDRYGSWGDGSLSGDVQNKLIDIRGDLKDRGPGFHGDHFGSWYRLWGAALFEGVSAHDENRPLCGNKVPNLFDDLHQVVGVVTSESLAYYDEEAKGDADPDQRKLEIDMAGAGTMSWMQSKLQPSTNERDCRNRTYLQTRPLSFREKAQ